MNFTKEPAEFDPSKPINVKFCLGINAKECNQLESVLQQLIRFHATDIRLLLSSPGGNVDRGIELHNMLMSLPINLTTHNVGMVDSIANVVFMAGKTRYASPNSRFMMHGVRRRFHTNGDDISLTEKELKEALTYVQRDNKRIADTIAQHSKMTVGKVLQSMKGDTLYTPMQAKELGIIDDITDVESVEAGNLLIIDSGNQRVLTANDVM